MEFGISPNTVSTIMSKKSKYKDAFYSGKDDTMQRARQASHEDVEKKLLDWFTSMRANNMPLSGPIIRAKATSIASQLGKTELECSDGWLSRLKKRHNIVFKNVCGERESVNISTLSNWTNDILLPTLKKYRPCDVFNADKTGLFWRILPDKTMAFKGQHCHGTKTSKERITVLCCSNVDGSCKWPLFVIGKLKNPRCFKGLKKLPVNYDANSKAWMTGVLFTQWMLEFDKKMYIENRRVLMVVDNCPAHPHIQNFKATELIFLPPYATSVVQPCDMGIINNVKCHYNA